MFLLKDTLCQGLGQGLVGTPLFHDVWGLSWRHWRPGGLDSWVCSRLEATSLPCLGLMRVVGWTLSWAVNQNTYAWPLHVPWFELPQSVASGVQENKVDVPGIFMCQPQVLRSTTATIFCWLGQWQMSTWVQGEGALMPPLTPWRIVRLHGKVSTCDGRYCCGHLWKTRI